MSQQPLTRNYLTWFIIPLAAIVVLFLISRGLQGSKLGEIVEKGPGYQGIRQAQGIVYDFKTGAQKVDLALTELLAAAGFVPSEITEVVQETTYTQGVTTNTRRSWLRPQLAEKISWPYKELVIAVPPSDAGLLVFDYQQMIEAKLWNGNARVVSEKLDKLGSNVGLTLEIGFRTSPGGNRVTIVTHKVTLVQPWVETYVQRFPRRVKPQVAIVIDDWGYHQPAAVEAMFGLPVRLNMAVIPGLSDSTQQALIGFARGWEVMLHLPMEPLNANWRLGEYAITTQMTEAEIRETFRKALRSVPGVSGINNHMGSRATADDRVMQVVLDEVKQTGLFFVDSRTSGGSVVPAVATRLGVPFTENLVFLDNEDNIDYILERLQLLVQVAKQNGQALGIGHLRLNTARALERFVQSVSIQEVELVFASQITER